MDEIVWLMEDYAKYILDLSQPNIVEDSMNLDILNNNPNQNDYKNYGMKPIDGIVQNFINLCSIKQHELYSRSKTNCDDRVTYYPCSSDFFKTDSVTISNQCSNDATEYLINSLAEYNEKHNSTD